MKILIPLDGSSCTGRLLEWLRGHKLLDDVHHELVALHVVERLACDARWLAPGPMEDYYTAQASPVWHLVEGFLKSYRVHAECRTEVGDPAPCIARIARDEGFDLIAMGSHGHGALVNVVMGSVATKVLASCDTAVLLVR